MAMGAAKEVVQEMNVDDAENFTNRQLARFQDDPKYYRDFVKSIEKDISSNFPTVCEMMIP